MFLGIEEDFGIPNVHLGGFFKVIHSQLVKVFRRVQRLETVIVRFKKAPVAGGQIAVFQFLHARELGVVFMVDHWDPVAFRELPSQFGRQSAFDVHVKFHLGQSIDKRIIDGVNLVVPMCKYLLRNEW